MNIIWSNLKCYISAAPAGDFPLDSQVWKPSAFISLHKLTQVENSNNTSLPLWNISNSLGEGVRLTLEVLGSNTAKNVCWVVKSVSWSWPAYHIVLILLFIFSDRTIFKFSFAPDSCWVFAAFSYLSKITSMWKTAFPEYPLALSFVHSNNSESEDLGSDLKQILRLQTIGAGVRRKTPYLNREKR